MDNAREVIIFAPEEIRSLGLSQAIGYTLLNLRLMGKGTEGPKKLKVKVEEGQSWVEALREAGWVMYLAPAPEE